MVSPPHDRIVVGVAVVLSLGSWSAVTALFSSAVPNNDGSIHGYFAARILATHSVDPHLVLSGDALGAGPFAAFYPLALHSVAAAISGTGIPVAVSVNAIWIVTVSLALPAGTWTLARRFCPEAPRVATLSALVSVAMPSLVPVSLTWGGIALVSGMAMLVPALALALQPSRRLLADTVLAILVVVGIAFTHTTELVSLGLVGVVLLATDSRVRAWISPWRPWAATWGGAVVALVIVAMPWVSAVQGGAQERVDIRPAEASAAHGLSTGLSFLVGPVADVLFVGFVVVGLIVGIRRRWLIGWGAVIAVVATMVVVLAVHGPGSLAWGLPWYSDYFRLSVLLTIPGILSGSVGIWWIVTRLSRRLGPMPGSDAGAGLRRTKVLVGSIVVAAALLPLGYESTAYAWSAYIGPDGPGTGGSLATPGARAAWEWLAEHTGPTDRVLNRFTDGSAWMYAESGVNCVFCGKPDPLTIWGDRGYLLLKAAEVSSDPRAAEALRAWNVRYVYVLDRVFPTDGVPNLTDHALTVRGLIAGGWTVVYRQGGATVLAPPRRLA